MFVIVHLSRGKDAAQRDSAIREKSGGTRSETSAAKFVRSAATSKLVPKYQKQEVANDNVWTWYTRSGGEKKET